MTEYNSIKISTIRAEDRIRTDHGDIQALADSIDEIGLLQPIGINEGNILVFGERRLKACQLLGWDEIPTRIVNIPDVISGEYAENEIRKDFTPSERVAILETIKTNSIGTNQHLGSSNLTTLNDAAKRVGLVSVITA